LALEQIKIEFSPDNMRAYLQIEQPPEGTAWPTYEQILMKIKEEGLVFGLKEQVLHRVLEEKSFNDFIIWLFNSCNE